MVLVYRLKSPLSQEHFCVTNHAKNYKGGFIRDPCIGLPHVGAYCIRPEPIHGGFHRSVRSRNMQMS